MPVFNPNVLLICAVAAFFSALVSLVVHLRKRSAIRRALNRTQMKLPLAPSPFPRVREVKYRDGIHLLAHRGLARCAMENSGTAMFLAAASGANGVEADVRFTSDGVPVLCHERQLLVLPDCFVPVEKTKFSELRKIRIPPANQIPSLDEFLSFAKRFQLVLLDLKDFQKDGGSAAALRTVADLIARHGMTGRVVIDSAVLDWCQQAKKLGLRVCLRAPKISPKEVLAAGIEHISVSAEYGKKYFGKHGWGGLKIFGVCTRSVDDAAWFFEHDAHAVITDLVEESLDWLEGKGYVVSQQQT